MNSLKVEAVKDRGGLSDFVNLPWRLYSSDPLWVPPIKAMQKRLLTVGKHPFWKNAERELFLARRGGKAVGRIAAIVNHASNQVHGEKCGVWGFFECEHDPEAAMALFGAAENWLRERGMESVRGPMNPSTNYEVGMLLEGFDTAPAFMMTYNPRYYLELVNACGYRKEKDLLSFRFGRDWQPPEWGWSVLERVESRWNVSIHRPDPKHLTEQLVEMNRIYQECWAGNWGFVPMRGEELAYGVKDLYFIFDPDFAGFVVIDGQPVGVFLMLPDINPFLKRLNGSMGLGALIKKRLYWSEVTGLRGLLMGIKEKYRRLGLPAVVVAHVMRALQNKPQYQYMELGWNLEDNAPINRLYEEDGGGMPCKRYRIYRKAL